MKKCSVEGCRKPAHARGWCEPHYKRWRRHGDPLGGGSQLAPKGEARQWLTEVALRHEGSECLPWPYCRGGGYGQVWLDGRMQFAHRLVCERVHGPAPSPEHECAHSCGDPGCVSPGHLRWATSKENAADKIGHGTAPRGERNGAAKLDRSEVLAIRSAIGLHHEIAARFGVDRSTVGMIKRQEIWAWLS